MFIEHRITAFIYGFAQNVKRFAASVIFFLHIRNVNGEKIISVSKTDVSSENSNGATVKADGY